MKKSLLALTLCLVATFAFAQEVSVKKELSLFSLSYSQWDVPSNLVSGVDAQIKGVFVNMGRFTVIGLSNRMENITPDEFIDKIKEFKDATTNLPEAVKMGEQQFTYADYQKLVGGFLLVIPQITNYIVDRTKGSNVEVSIDTSFTFINVATMEAVAVINMSTNGKDENARVAAKEAMDAIPNKLTFEIRSIPEFQIKTGVVEVQGDGSIVLELGAGMGIQVGDEYQLKSSAIESFGFRDSEGLVIVKRVSAEFSEAYVVYGKPTLGSPLQEIPRFGGEVEPYFVMGPKSSDDNNMRALLGLKTKWTRGTFGVYPTGSIDLDPSYLVAAIFSILPVNVFAGGEAVLMMGRLDILLGASVGGTGIYYLGDNASEPVGFSHFGAKADIAINYLMSDDMKLSITGGARYMLGILSWSNSEFFKSYLHPYAGIGLAVKL